MPDELIISDELFLVFCEQMIRARRAMPGAVLRRLYKMAGITPGPVIVDQGLYHWTWKDMIYIFEKIQSRRAREET